MIMLDKMVHIRLTEYHLEKLDAIKNKMGLCNRSEVVRLAIYVFIKNENIDKELTKKPCNKE